MQMHITSPLPSPSAKTACDWSNLCYIFSKHTRLLTVLLVIYPLVCSSSASCADLEYTYSKVKVGKVHSDELPTTVYATEGDTAALFPSTRNNSSSLVIQRYTPGHQTVYVQYGLISPLHPDSVLPSISTISSKTFNYIESTSDIHNVLYRSTAVPHDSGEVLIQNSTLEGTNITVTRKQGQYYLAYTTQSGYNFWNLKEMQKPPVRTYTIDYGIAPKYGQEPYTWNYIAYYDKCKILTSGNSVWLYNYPRNLFYYIDDHRLQCLQGTVVDSILSKVLNTELQLIQGGICAKNSSSLILLARSAEDRIYVSNFNPKDSRLDVLGFFETEAYEVSCLYSSGQLLITDLNDTGVTIVSLALLGEGQ